MLSLSNITKKYGSFRVLEGVDLEFTRGVYALLAPNGAGKTTLIKMLTTLIHPSGGQILWNGDDIVHLGASYRSILGYLPQDFGYYKNQSPRKFLEYLGAVKALDRRTAIIRTDRLLDLVGLSEVADKKMRKLSGGMIQRVGIAQALLNEPKVLILDEPTAGLDPQQRVHFRNLIARLSQDRIVICSTHIVSDVETIANHVVMIKDGAIWANDPPAQICRRLEGKVYETSDIQAVYEPHLLLTQRQDGTTTVSRFFSEADCSLLATRVEPNLEDVFLWAYRDQA
ncbi:MAG: ABC transporter ATP-binding protein [Propionibacteriaceae bacterium]|jgi:ABC-type multidrug transport system ATPase subunit|nr:ABC transporter ATP-binding protein [Propionibacteriaceae bacterium]